MAETEFIMVNNGSDYSFYKTKTVNDINGNPVVIPYLVSNDTFTSLDDRKIELDELLRVVNANRKRFGL